MTNLPPAPFGPLGTVIYARTYSRWLPEEGRRERWPETVRRVTDYSAELAPIGDEERAALYDTIYHLRALPAGRTLWVGGTDHVRRFPQANYNCAFTSLASVDDLHDLVILLMNGAGVGFGVRPAEVSRFAAQGAYHPARNVVIEDYAYVGTPGTEERTLATVNGDRLTLTVGDSREGWAVFAREFVRHYLFGGWHGIHVNLNAVRPLGSPLRTFGGTASGPEPLMDFIQGVVGTFRVHGGITDTALLDTANLIGRMVVAGGTRRSAQIGLGSPESHPYVTAKTGEWWNDAPWRSQSNNSVVFESRPSREKLLPLFESVLQFGEPGFINGEAARQRRRDWTGLNPCAEILLGGEQDNGAGFCNLVTVNLGRYAHEPLNPAQFAQDVRLLTRHAVRVTLVTMNGIQAKWDRQQKADRLIGVSFTGYGDYADAHGEAAALDLLRTMRQTVREAADSYAAELGIPRPLLTTTVKPEGTLSLLCGTSSGLHDAYAPYYVRRVRISEQDAVAQTLDFMGVPNHPDPHGPGTRVFEFPVKTRARQKASDKPATEQLERYFAVMDAYVEHNASNTISLSADEVPAVTDLLLSRWDEYVAVSFLAKDTNSYPLMPFEAISAEEYERRAARMPDLSRFSAHLEARESVMTATDDLEAACEGAACPTR